MIKIKDYDGYIIGIFLVTIFIVVMSNYFFRLTEISSCSIFLILFGPLLTVKMIYNGGFMHFCAYISIVSIVFLILMANRKKKMRIYLLLLALFIWLTMGYITYCQLYDIIKMRGKVTYNLTYE